MVPTDTLRWRELQIHGKVILLGQTEEDMVEFHGAYVLRRRSCPLTSGGLDQATQDSRGNLCQRQDPASRAALDRRLRHTVNDAGCLVLSQCQPAGLCNLANPFAPSVPMPVSRVATPLVGQQAARLAKRESTEGL